MTVRTVRLTRCQPVVTRVGGRIERRREGKTLACAVSCTGIGEDFIRNAVAYDISARMEYKHQSLDDAIAEVLNNPERLVRGGIIAVGHQGEIVMRFNTPGMARAAADSKGLHEVHVQE